MKKTKEQISYNMSRVKNKDSQIEITLRKELWARGIRYRKNVGKVIGKPDIAFLGKKVAVFCVSEFWHGYDWENRKKEFKTNQDFWIPKIERNMERDIEVNTITNGLNTLTIIPIGLLTNNDTFSEFCLAIDLGVISPNISTNIVITIVTIPTPLGPISLTAIDVASADAPMFTILFPINIAPNNLLGS